LHLPGHRSNKKVRSLFALQTHMEPSSFWP
jgi:hypothetical protein